MHEVDQAAPAGAVADVLQIPAFLSRQTDLLVGRGADRARREHQEGPVPGAPRRPARRRQGHRRGQRRTCSSPSAASRSATTTSSSTCARFPMMRELGVPVVFDVTHSLQLPGAGDGVTAGLAAVHRAAGARRRRAGVDGVFLEVHEDPARAKSDAPERPATRPASSRCFVNWCRSMPSPEPRDPADGRRAARPRAGAQGAADRSRGHPRARRPPRRAVRAAPWSCCATAAAG